MPMDANHPKPRQHTGFFKPPLPSVLDPVPPNPAQVQGARPERSIPYGPPRMPAPEIPRQGTIPGNPFLDLVMRQLHELFATSQQAQQPAQPASVQLGDVLSGG